MARLQDVVFDCRHPAALARFWAAVLDGYEVAPYDDAELSRLRSLGIDDPEGDPTVLVHHPGHHPGSPPRLWFQAVPEGKTGKNRVHLDLVCDDALGEVKRLEPLGARALAHQPNQDLIVMQDPEGNEFCILRAGHQS